MQYKTKLLVYIIVMNLLIIGLAFFFMKSNNLLFIILEVIFVTTIFLGISLFRQFSKTMDLISSGIESLKDHDFSMKLRPVGNKEFNAFIEVYNKMIDQLRKERIALSEKSYLLAKLMEASPSGILIFDYDDQLTNVNPAAEKYMNISAEEIIQMKLETLSETVGGMLENSRESADYVFRKNGNEAYRIQTGFFVDRGFDTRFILIDELTNEIYEAEKQAYGKVIRMMSHEVNNSMAAVNSLLQSIRPKLDNSKDHQMAVDTCISRNENLNDFLGNFASVIRIPKPEFKDVNLNDLASNTLLLFKNQPREKKIHFSAALSEEPVIISADNSQIEQVLINVLKNACEAVEHEGQVEIITGREPSSIRITDNGRGILPGQQEKVFTPFYSTKSHGQGIGLTLSREILMNHHCRFHLKTDADTGKTEFVIYFK